MSDIKVNPFNNMKKTNWAKKAQDRLNVENQNESEEREKRGENGEKRDERMRSERGDKNSKLSNPKSQSHISRVAKSFKVYPGKIPRDFDKRVNKLQVHFDDLDMPKDYVDSGKYMMFLMSLAEKYKLYELYTTVSENGDFSVDEEELKKKFN